MKRVVILSDTHHGHMAGLTPEGWFLPLDSHSHVRNKFALWQRESWKWFVDEIDSLGPIDVLFHLGDWIEGKGERSGGTELLMSDRIEQASMAEAVFEKVNPKQARFIFGTPSHVGRDEDWEQVIADHLDVPIGSHSWPEVEGVVFDLKHKVGSSGIPQGRFTAIAKSKMWNTLQAERELQPRSNVLLRGHVHYYGFTGGVSGLNMTLPALQGWGSKFGSRECEGDVDFGFVVFDCEGGNYTFTPHLMDMRPFAPKVDVL